MSGVPAALTAARRTERSGPVRAILEMAGALGAALAVGAVLMLVAGANPIVGYGAMLDGAFGSVNNLAEVLVKAIPLLLAGLGIAVAFRAGYWNIGAEGQLLMGATAAAWVGLLAEGWSPAGTLLLVLLAGFAVGALWGLIPGVLRARFGASEIIVTIMFNYIAFLGVNYLVTAGPIAETGRFLPQTDPIAWSATLPVILEPTRLHAGLFIAMAAVGAMYWFLVRSTWGYRVRVVGANPEAARYGGVSVGKTWVLVSVLAGGLAGLAGMAEVSGTHHRLYDDVSAGMGFTAIVIALLGHLHPVGVAVAAVLFAALHVGAHAMQRVTGVPVTLVYVIQALVVLFFLGRAALGHGQLLRRFLRRERV